MTDAEAEALILWPPDVKKVEHKELMLLNCGVGEDSWTATISSQSILKEMSPNIHWKD